MHKGEAMQGSLKRKLKQFWLGLLLGCVVLAGVAAGWSAQMLMTRAAGNQLMSLSEQFSPLVARAHAVQPLDSGVQLLARSR